MKTLIVYDSLYGNTEKIAQVLNINCGEDSNMVKAEKFRDDMIDGVDLLIIGSPVHGGRPMPTIDHLLDGLPPKSLANKKVAAFDTRFEENAHGLGLKIVMKVLRFASERMIKKLEDKGGSSVGYEGFIVEDKKGPLKKGELDRAREWIKRMLDYEA